MSLLRRRIMMQMQEGDADDMRDWKTLYEETLTEDKNITISNIDCKEVEAYIISSGYETTDNIYLTSNATGTIYGDPRIYVATRTTAFIIRLGLYVVAPYIMRAEKVQVPYYNDLSGQTIQECILHKTLNQDYNIQSITEISLAAQNLLKAGDRVYIRGR